MYSLNKSGYITTSGTDFYMSDFAIKFQEGYIAFVTLS